MRLVCAVVHGRHPIRTFVLRVMRVWFVLRLLPVRVLEGSEKEEAGRVPRLGSAPRIKVALVRYTDGLYDKRQTDD